MINNMDKRFAALVSVLNETSKVNTNNIVNYNNNHFKYCNNVYMVLTNKEANREFNNFKSSYIDPCYIAYLLKAYRFEIINIKKYNNLIFKDIKSSFKENDIALFEYCYNNQLFNDECYENIKKVLSSYIIKTTNDKNELCKISFMSDDELQDEYCKIFSLKQFKETYYKKRESLVLASLYKYHYLTEKETEDYFFNKYTEDEIFDMFIKYKVLNFKKIMNVLNNEICRCEMSSDNIEHDSKIGKSQFYIYKM